MPSLAELVAAEHLTWEDPLVDREVFGTTAPDAIAAVFERFSADALGSRAAGARFYRVSIGCVAALDLVDGRTVVVKAQRAKRSLTYLEACRNVTRHLAANGFPCPAPIGRIMSIGDAWLAAETFLDAGAPGDARVPSVRASLAAGLARMVDLARGFARDSAFKCAWITALPEERVFPKPHSPLFDFEATHAGAEWIDDLARAARAVGRSGERVIGHFDWRVEHARFDGSALVATFDWDSLHAELEPIVVGASAHAFTADWERKEIEPAPSIEDVRAYVADYESARGKAFEAFERRALAASWVYSTAYTARCNHASGLAPGGRGDFRPILREHGERALREGF
jgi:hypothetical protein